MPTTTTSTGEIVSTQAAPDNLNTIDEIGAKVQELVEGASADADTLAELDAKIDAQRLTIDQTLDAASTNPVENRAVFSGINGALATTGQRINELVAGAADDANTFAKVDAKIEATQGSITSAVTAMGQAQDTARSQAISDLIGTAPDNANTLGELYSLVTAQRPESSSITWDSLPSPLVEGERFVQARNEDGADWLFAVPAAIAGQVKGAIWNAAEEARYTAIGVPPAGVTELYLDNIRIYVRSAGTNAGSRFSLTFYDVENNPYPASRFVVSGTLTQWAGGNAQIVLNRSVWGGSLGLGHNKQGYLHFYWVGGEALMNGLSRITVSAVSTSVGQIQITYLNSPEVVIFGTPGAVTTTRFTTRTIDLVDLTAKVQALEAVDHPLPRLAVPPEGAEIGSHYSATADLTLLDMETDQVGQTSTIVNNAGDPIILTPGRFSGVQMQVVFGDDFTPTGDFRNTVALQPGDRLKLWLDRPEGVGHVLRGEFLELAAITELRNKDRFQPVPAGGMLLGRQYYAIADATFAAVTAEQVGESIFLANDSDNTISLVPPTLSGTIVPFLKEDGEQVNTFSVQSGETVGFRLAEISGTIVLKEFPNEAGGTPQLYGAIANLPSPNTVVNGSLAWVLEDPTAGLNGLYGALGAVGQRLASRWQKVTS